MVLDSADAINDGDGDDDDESYLNLEFFLPDAPTVDVIITTRHAGAAEMTTLAAVEVGEMETTEAAELFQKCAKLQSPTPDVEYGSATDRGGIGEACAGDHAGGILCRSDTTAKVGHPLISAGVSRTTETVTEHEGK